MFGTFWDHVGGVYSQMRLPWKKGATTPSYDLPSACAHEFLALTEIHTCTYLWRKDYVKIKLFKGQILKRNKIFMS